MRNLTVLLRIPCTLEIPSLLLLLGVSLLYQLIMRYLDMDHFDFILPGVYWDPCLWRSMFFIKLGKLSDHYFFKYSSCPFLSLLLGLSLCHYAYIDILVVPLVSEAQYMHNGIMKGVLENSKLTYGAATAIEVGLIINTLYISIFSIFPLILFLAWFLQHLIVVLPYFT